ncbi:MAG: SPFH domain-containing protein, partial [Planctomycetota bacterium]
MASVRYDQGPGDFFESNFQRIQFSWGWLTWMIPLIVILMLLSTSFYMVDTDSKGVVQRFGKFNRITEPGLHFKLPLNI